MSLFGSDTNLTTLALAVGRLEAEVKALRAELSARPSVAPVVSESHALPERISTVIASLAQKDAGLRQHLEQEARLLMASEVGEGAIVERLVMGTR